MNSLNYIIYGLPVLVLLVWHVLRRRRFERKSEEIRAHTGSAEPASLHPIINERCIAVPRASKRALSRSTMRFSASFAVVRS